VPGLNFLELNLDSTKLLIEKLIYFSAKSLKKLKKNNESSTKFPKKCKKSLLKIPSLRDVFFSFRPKIYFI